MALSNPFPGHPDSRIAGPHAVEMLFLFNTLQERYPAHRDNFYARQATETARRWIAFANGKEPWERYHAEEGKTAIFDDLVGWETRKREEDERISQDDP
jgi:carboxylesterase type B